MGVASAAAAQSIDFEGVLPPLGAPVSGHYSSQGVVFDNGSIGAAGAQRTAPSAHSGERFVHLFPGEFASPPLRFTFGSPQLRVRFYGGTAQGVNGGPVRATALAFDAGGAVVARDGPKGVVANAIATPFELEAATAAIVRVELFAEYAAPRTPTEFHAADTALDDLAFEAPAGDDSAHLAHRFRPVLKFSSGESHLPCSWPWLYSHSYFRVRGEPVLDADQLALHPERVLEWADVRHWTADVAASSILPNEPAYAGQSWTSVREDGAGIYAHVTALDARLVLIEYWFLYAFNDGNISATTHLGDLTGVAVVFDRDTDRLVRSIFSIHGDTLVAFDLTRAIVTGPALLPGLDILGNPIATPVMRFDILTGAHFQAGGSYFLSDADTVAYLAVDEVSGKPEHLAVFVELGTHEPWPNSTGFFTAAPNHDGDGVAILPRKVHLLGPSDDPFTYFGGNFDDPVGITRHWLWFGPHDPDRSTDANPYVAFGPLPWPPEPTSACRWSPYFSEESEAGAVCGGAVEGLGCSGGYCDDVTICCSEGSAPAATGDGSWSPWFSEEDPDRAICAEGQYVDGVRCAGGWCDRMAVRCRPTARTRASCAWTEFVSEEEGTAKCGSGQFLAGLRCEGGYCDGISLYCCGWQ